MRTLVLFAVALLVAACTSGSPGRTHHHTHDPDPVASAEVPQLRAPSGPTTAAAVRCPPASTTVHDAAGLTAALAAAHPGTVIVLTAGTYQGRFTATAAGTAQQPIYLCGLRTAVLDAGSVTGGYVFHLDRARYWRLSGFTVQDGQKGVVADRTQHTIIDSLAVHDIGDEAIHLRVSSTDNVVSHNILSETGKRRDKFGEGVYVGTAKSNWCTYSNCEPDPSDRNLVIGNRITGTTAEAVDVKEGTRYGVIAGNTFDGSALQGADSWVDVKGNAWLVSGNTGTHWPADGFQTHEIVHGDGADNVFTANTADVDGPGYGFHFAPVNRNVLRCDNHVRAAGQGVGNVSCTA